MHEWPAIAVPQNSPSKNFSRGINVNRRKWCVAYILIHRSSEGNSSTRPPYGRSWRKSLYFILMSSVGDIMWTLLATCVMKPVHNVSWVGLVGRSCRVSLVVDGILKSGRISEGLVRVRYFWKRHISSTAQIVQRICLCQ